MIDKKAYLESLVETDLQKFIINHIDEEPDKLIDLCIKFLKDGNENA